MQSIACCFSLYLSCILSSLISIFWTKSSLLGLYISHIWLNYSSAINDNYSGFCKLCALDFICLNDLISELGIVNFCSEISWSFGELDYKNRFLFYYCYFLTELNTSIGTINFKVFISYNTIGFSSQSLLFTESVFEERSMRLSSY